MASIAINRLGEVGRAARRSVRACRVLTRVRLPQVLGPTAVSDMRPADGGIAWGSWGGYDGDQPTAGGGWVTSGIGEKSQLASRLGQRGGTSRRPRRLRVPPSLFSVALGLAGLATAWHAAGAKLGTPAAVPYAIDILAAVVLVPLFGLYAPLLLRTLHVAAPAPVHAPHCP